MRTMAGCPELRGAVDLDRFTEGMLLEQGAEMPFLDVRPQDWYAKGVTELFERGLLQGLRRTGLDRTVPPSGLRW